MEFYEEQLKPCPFCGGPAYYKACDRLIKIGCEKCDYYRWWNGIVQSDHVTDVVASYSKQTGLPLEWYDKDADIRAVEAWNRRAENATA